MLKTDTGLTPSFFQPNAEADSPLRFNLKPLTGEQMIDLSEHAVQTREGAILKPRGTMMAARFAVVGWENWHDANGQIVPFTPAMIGFIPWEFLLKIGNEVVRRNTMPEEDKKNS
jgi:hypothetical protein